MVDLTSHNHRLLFEQFNRRILRPRLLDLDDPLVERGELLRKLVNFTTSVSSDCCVYPWSRR